MRILSEIPAYLNLGVAHKINNGPLVLILVAVLSFSIINEALLIDFGVELVPSPNLSSSLSFIGGRF